MDHNEIAKITQLLWAKKEERNGQFYWLPLKVHLEDTMNVASWLWNHWISEGERKYISSQVKWEGSKAEEYITGNLICFLGCIHDIGKATPAFQIQKGYTASPDLDQVLLEKLENIGFSGISNLELVARRKSHHTIAGEVILHGFGIQADITSVVGAHHGRPASDLVPGSMDPSDDVLYKQQMSAYPENYYQSEDCSSSIAGKWKRVQEYIFEWACEESGFEKNDPPEISQPGQVILSGFIIMADWIASNERYFPLLPLEETDEMLMIDQDFRFASGMQKWYRSLPLCMKKNEDAYALFQHRFGFAPRNFQNVVFDTVNQLNDPGIVVIEAPTGSGKTEAALAAVEELAAVTGRSGLFFGLPTQATSDGIFGRIYSWVESLAHDYGNASIRLVHGKAALNELMSELKKKNELYSEEIIGGIAEDENDLEGNGTVLINEWFSGRKTSVLDDYVTGTVDQFLLMALKQKHLALRHLGFSKKIVVIDEVHAYDAYMQQYLQEALRWSGAYHIPVILLSATLPKETKDELIYHYMKGRGVKSERVKHQLEALKGKAYPMMIYSDGDIISEETDFEVIPDRTFSLCRLEEKELYNAIDNLVRDGGIVGIIVNTVKRAQQIAVRCCDLFGKDAVELLHANFIATDRVEKEKHLIQLIGKDANRPERKIIIGTQVLEQSLDIDFDVLITDLCPMDLLIQRIGRVHRHPIPRPERHRKPVIYLLGESDTWEFESGTSYIYGEYLLARTQMCLSGRESIRIPSDVPELVQMVYDRANAERLSVPLNLKEKYNEIRENFFIKREKMKAKARAFRLNDPKLRIRPEKNNLIGWLDMTSETESEEAAYAQVRDTQETIEVIAVRKIRTGYGIFHSEQDMSGGIGTPETDRLLARQTLRLPYFITAGKIDAVIKELEQYNRTNLPDWQNSPWLKGSLGIIFDEENQFIIGGKGIVYDTFLGLMQVKEEE